MKEASTIPVRHSEGSDLLLRNSVLLMVATVTTAGLGFLFWVLAARTFSADAVGVASSLTSALSLLSYLSLGGLNGTLIRFLGSGRLRNLQITQGLVAVLLAGLVLGAGYVVIAPRIVPRLALLGDSVWFSILFVVAAMLASVNLLTDSVFMGLRAPGYNSMIDGFLQGLTKIAVLAAVAGTGAVGIFGSTAAGFLTATVASLLVLAARFGYRPAVGNRLAFNRTQAEYSLGTYVSSALNIAPMLIVPLVVLHAHDAASAAYYFMAFQVATLLYSFAYAVGESNFSEASRFPERHKHLMWRSARLMALVVIPGSAGMAIVGPFVLRLFGTTYAANGRSLLVVLALAAVPLGLNAWASFLLKITAQIRAMVVSNLVFAGTVVYLTLLWSDRPLVWVGLAWFVGNLASALIALVALFGPQATSTSDGPKR